ncbi:MAG: TIGR03619 family F420-dependent LLM class oxidoreductase [Anaerolineae bacterium]|nr:TIGR03619 family F420-dependent LLM class oxidoreductase [Anaerolineae bacterium]
MTVQYGVYLPNYGVFGDVGRMVALAAEAENAGWDGFFVWDHMAYRAQDGGTLPVIDPWIALAAVALQTTRVRIGTTVTPLPRRRPWKLARETVTLDQLSGGRVILGVGIGLGKAEWDDLGEEPEQHVRGQMLDEALAILRGLWSGVPFSFAGQHYQITNAQFLPRPVQEQVPIWVGGFWPNKAPFRRMARWDGMFPLFEAVGSTEERLFAEAVQFVQAERANLGRTGAFDVVKVGVTPGPDTPENAQEAVNRVRPAVAAGATWWLELLMPEVYGFAPDDPADDPAAFEALRARVLQGPPRVDA